MPLPNAYERVFASLAFGAVGQEPIAVEAANPLPVSGPLTDAQLRASAVPVTEPALSAGTDRSGSITVAATAQQLAAANAARKRLRMQNISAGDLWINETGATAAVDGAGSFKVAAGASFEVATNQAVSILGATLGQKFSATET